MSSPPAINHAVILATTLAVLLSLASLTNSLGSTAFAQGNQTATASSSSNQTGAQVTGQPETTVLNETTIPAQQTNVTVNQTAEPVSPQALQPLENLTQSQSAANLSGFENKTMVGAGEANQTTGQQNQTGGGQQEQQQQANNATSSQPSASGAGGGGANQTQQQQQQQQQANNATSQPAAGGGGGGGTQEENQQNNTQGQGNDPLSQMGESLGNIFGQ